MSKPHFFSRSFCETPESFMGKLIRSSQQESSDSRLPKETSSRNGQDSRIHRCTTIEKLELDRVSDQRLLKPFYLLFLTRSFLYCTKATKFSRAPSARNLNSGNFLRSIFLICMNNLTNQSASSKVRESGRTAARTPPILVSRRGNIPPVRKFGTSYSRSSSA